MSNYVEDNSYLKYNPQFGIEPEFFNYTPFYITIAIASVLAFILILVNLICCCCSEHTPYWADPDTGNRFASFLFVRSAKQKPLDVLYV